MHPQLVRTITQIDGYLYRDNLTWEQIAKVYNMSVADIQIAFEGLLDEYRRTYGRDWYEWLDEADDDG